MSRRMMWGAVVAAALAGGFAARGWAEDRAGQRSGEYLSTVSSAATSLVHPAAPAAGEDVAGEMFGIPVSMANYAFAKRVAYMYPGPWGAADLPEDKREDFIWEALMLHYQSFQRGIEATEDEVEEMIAELLRNDQQTFTRRSDPEAYRKWVQDHLGAEPILLENQVRYLLQIKKLRDRVREEQVVTVRDEEMQQEFLNEKNHVGGEMVTFDSREAAQDFYEHHKDPAAWDAMKAAGQFQVRPVSLMTLEAYIDLWRVPKDQMYALHALEIGQVDEPIPFGKQWCIYRLLDKRTGDLAEFPAQRDNYRKQLEARKKYEAVTKWLDDLKTSAHLKVYVGKDTLREPAPSAPAAAASTSSAAPASAPTQ